MKKKQRKVDLKGEEHPAWKGGMRRANLRRNLKKKSVQFTEDELDLHESITHCPICSIELESGIGSRAKHFDHNHKTKKYRGTICASCNLALAMTHDDPAILQKLIDYLNGKEQET